MVSSAWSAVNSFNLLRILAIINFWGIDILISGLYPGFHVLRIGLDSSCHALLSGVVWLLVDGLPTATSNASCTEIDISRRRNSNGRWCALSQKLYQYRELLVSLILGVAVDVDHFVAAGSLSLTAATHLSSRPFGHAYITCLFLSMGVWSVSGSRRWGLLVHSAYLVHLLRDSTRRGLWLLTIPAYSTSGSSSSALKSTAGVGVAAASARILSTPPLSLCLVLLLYTLGIPLVNRLLLYGHLGTKPSSSSSSSSSSKSGNGRSSYSDTSKEDVYMV